MLRRLSDIAKRLPGSRMIGAADPIVERVTSDSREDGSDGLFVAVRGFKSNGNDFIGAALKQGAVALISGDESALLKQDSTIGRLLVSDDRLALAIASDTVYDHPTGQLKLVGVTGTNGKTTTVTLSAAILEAAGFRAATLGTLGLAVGNRTMPGDRTTPEAPAIQRLMKQLVSDGITAVAMEVASHALDLKRTWGCAFDVGVFTNLTQDHLDYHGTMEDYFAAKKRLFTEYPAFSDKPFNAVINVDDPFGARLAREITVPTITFGLAGDACLAARDPLVTPTSVSFTASYRGASFPVSVPVGAHFNVSNALAAIGVGLALDVPHELIVRGLAAAAAVPGRFESVSHGQPFTVIVDYAHTPDGLLNVLRSARQITSGRLLAVFGCGGDRDSGKRPKMGGIAADHADRIIVTSDNPRSEDPEGIIREIFAGIPREAAARATAVADRKDAIEQALDEARPGDVVVIAGKGHENYQIFADRTIHFDDREVVSDLLKGRAAS